MPRIVPNDPLLSGFNPTSPLVLPKLFGPAWGGAGGISNWSKSAFAKANYDQWADVTGRITGQLAILDGVPGWALDGFGDFFAKMPTVRASDVVSELLGSAAKAVNSALAETSTAIPILGLVVQLGLGIYESITALIQAEKAWKESQKPPPGQAIVFDSSDNEAMATAIINASTEDDWTRIFSPPSTSGEWFARHVTWVPGAPGQGWAFGTHGDLGAGLMPGMAECVGTLYPEDGSGYTNYQFANKTQGGLFGAEFDLPPLSTAGELTPSTRQLAILLWQSVMKPSVAMFRIDSNALQSYWLDYYEGLAEFAESLRTDSKVENVRRGNAWERGLNPKLAFNEALSATTYLTRRMTKSGELELLYPTSKLTTKSPGALPQLPSGVTMLDLESAGPLTYTYADIVRFVCVRHRIRAAGALQTLVCAYVPPNAPALRNNAGLAKHHDEMRRRLLVHRAVNQVELELIPDSEYRSAVSQAQHRNDLVADVGFGIIGADGKAPTKNRPGQPPTVDGGPEPDVPDSPPPGMPGRMPMPGGSSMVLPAIGVTAAVGLAAFLILRKRRR